MGLNFIKNKLFKSLSYKFAAITSSINLKPVEFKLHKGQHCLCLSPHADDESIGMGGLLSLYPKNFDIVLLTNGKKGIKDLPEEEVIKIRENEFKCSMKIAGIDEYKFIRAQDKHLLEAFELFKTIDLSKYDFIFVPNIIDQHPDHKAVSLLLNKLLESGVSAKPDLKICFYEVWSTLGFVNTYVDISEIIENKKEMINCYKSQTSQKNYEYHALGLNQYRGMLKDKKYVEAFFVLNLLDFNKFCKLY